MTQEPPGATLLTNAVIYTGDPDHPWTSALGVRDGLVETLDSDPVGSYAVRDLGGAFVMPGLVDAHNHHAIAGVGELYEFALPVEAGIDGLIACVRARLDSHPQDEWVVGNGWSPLLLDAVATPAALE